MSGTAYVIYYEDGTSERFSPSVVEVCLDKGVAEARVAELSAKADEDYRQQVDFLNTSVSRVIDQMIAAGSTPAETAQRAAAMKAEFRASYRGPIYYLGSAPIYTRPDINY